LLITNTEECGARCVTVTNIHWTDITSCVQLKDEDDKWNLKIALRVLKGNLNSEHIVSFIGNFKNPGEFKNNAVYWIYKWVN